MDRGQIEEEGVLHGQIELESELRGAGEAAPVGGQPEGKRLDSRGDLVEFLAGQQVVPFRSCPQPLVMMGSDSLQLSLFCR